MRQMKVIETKVDVARYFKADEATSPTMLCRPVLITCSLRVRSESKSVLPTAIAIVTIVIGRKAVESRSRIVGGVGAKVSAQVTGGR